MNRAVISVAGVALMLSACSDNSSDSTPPAEGAEVTSSTLELSAYDEQFLAQLSKYASVDDIDALNMAYDGCSYMEDGYMMGQLNVPTSPLQQNLDMYPSVSERDVHYILSLALTNICPWNATERFVP